MPPGADVAGDRGSRLVDGEREAAIGGGESGFEPDGPGAQDGDARLRVRHF
jgi:hypothetical protein